MEDLNKYYDNHFETIYLGGGTPSSLNLEQFKRLLQIVYPYSKEVDEYTIELNPETMDEDKVDLLKEYGVNRVSIGLQSANENLLKLMNRKHSYEDVKRLVFSLKEKGIDNISIDVMYSLPDQTIDDLKDTLNKVIELDVKHVSLYSLTVEENTVFGKKGYKSLDSDIEADMYEYIEDFLNKNGFIHYEVANYCKKNYYSRHNMAYWRYKDFIGLGPGASGKEGNRRYAYTRNISNYLNNTDIYDEDIRLDIKEEAFEHLMMSFRTIEGLNIKEFEERYQINFKEEYQEAIEKNRKYLDINEERCICTNRELLNTILVDFMNYQ